MAAQDDTYHTYIRRSTRVPPSCKYEFKRGFATTIFFIVDLRRNVPYFYNTFWVEKITLVAELNVIPDAPWW